MCLYLMTLDTSSLTMCTTRYRDPVMLRHTPMILNNVLKLSHRNHVFGRAKPCLLRERQTYSTQSSTTLTEERVYSVNKNDLDELTYYAAYCVSAGSQMLPCAWQIWTEMSERLQCHQRSVWHHNVIIHHNSGTEGFVEAATGFGAIFETVLTA